MVTNSLVLKRWKMCVQARQQRTPSPTKKKKKQTPISEDRHWTGTRQDEKVDFRSAFFFYERGR